MTHYTAALGVELGKFFPSCPLCQKEKVIKLQFHVGWNMNDYIVCSDCNARWLINDVTYWQMDGHTYAENLRWVKLIEAGSSGKGESYLGTEHEPTFWFNMIVNKPVRKQGETEKQQSTVIREKEIIRKTEVIYKVKCPYCGKLYNEVLDVCPHCGGKR